MKLEQGLQVVKIFKEHASKQCILDDFEFYEDRQKKIQEKKAKQQQFQKQVNICSYFSTMIWIIIKWNSLTLVFFRLGKENLLLMRRSRTELKWRSRNQLMLLIQ